MYNVYMISCTVSLGSVLQFRLHWAAMSGHHEIVQYLIKRWVKVDAVFTMVCVNGIN